MKCPVCSKPYPCPDVSPDRSNPYGWDRSEEREPIDFWNTIPDVRLEWIKSNMEHEGVRAVASACQCGLSEEYIKGNKMYAKHGIPSGECYRHGTNEAKPRQHYRDRRLKRGQEDV